MSVVHSDADMVEGLRQGKRSAQEAFYKSYFGQMFPTAQRYSSNREDAYDIINTAFLKVINSIENYKTDNFGGWVRTIVQRTAIDYCRKYRYNKPTQVEFIEPDERAYNTALSNLQVEDLMKLLEKLPNASRTVFNMFVFDQCTHEEIAKHLNISKGTSKWHVSNARKILQDLIDKN